MTEPCDRDQPMADEPQVATGSLVGPPPSNPPPPPPGACMMHADDVTEEWASDDDSNNANDANQAKSAADKHEVNYDDVSDDEPSSQASDDDASDASEDVISVLAQAAVEEAMEAAVRQAQSPVNDAHQDSINANFAASHNEHQLTSMENRNSPNTRRLSGLGSRPTGAVSQSYHDNEDSDDSEEDYGRWRFEENSPPPSLPRPTSRCSPGSTNQMQPTNHSDESKVTLETEICLCLTFPRVTYPTPVPMNHVPDSPVPVSHVPDSPVPMNHVPDSPVPVSHVPDSPVPESPVEHLSQ